jgi:hypothetical protein
MDTAALRGLASTSTEECRRFYSYQLIRGLGIAFLKLPDVKAVGIFGKTETRDGSTTLPKLLLAVAEEYFVEKYASFLKRHASKINEHGLPLVTRAAATHTFESGVPDFQGIIGDYESASSSTIGDALMVYVLPLTWQQQTKRLQGLFGSTIPEPSWKELHETARLIK